AARAAEARARGLAGGWEVDLRIAVDGMIPVARLYPSIARFDRQRKDTHVRVLSEPFGGCGDALRTDRADLAIGAAEEGPPDASTETRTLGVVRFAFVVPPGHPLANAREPIPSSEIRTHRSISTADGTRLVARRIHAPLEGQRVLTVPDLEAKVEAHCAGLGVGFLPRWLAEREVAAGRLLIKAVEEPKEDVRLSIAWHSDRGGEAREWFIEHLESPKVRAALIAGRGRRTMRREGR
ncbi:MAG: LysR substrate-binding domain-containing protein, partial [Candidatus Binatia bacterium]